MIISENERNLETKEFEKWSKDYDEIPDVDLLKMKQLLETNFHVQQITLQHAIPKVKLSQIKVILKILKMI